MTADNGSSMSQAKVHNEVRMDLRKADARALAATINRDVIAPYVALNFGANVKPPRVRWAIEEPEDLVAYMTAVEKFVKLGGKVQASVVRDKLGLPDPENDSDLLGAPSPETASPPPSADGADGAPGSPSTPDDAPDEEAS
jgi:phage gp29-like protein